MNLVSRLLPPEHVVLGMDAGSKKRLFEQVGLLFENTRQIRELALSTTRPLLPTTS